MSQTSTLRPSIARLVLAAIFFSVATSSQVTQASAEEGTTHVCDTASSNHWACSYDPSGWEVGKYCKSGSCESCYDVGTGSESCNNHLGWMPMEYE